MVVNGGRLSVFDNGTVFHDQHVSAQPQGGGKVVGDKQHRGAGLPQTDKQIHRLVAVHNIQRGGRFIRDNKLGVGSERHSDQYTLYHAA